MNSDIRLLPSVESVGSMLQRRHEFRNYPPCQREKIWSAPYKRRAIDSILHSFPIGAIVIVKDDSSLMGTRYFVLDGQQRLETIIEFADGKFKTAQKGWTSEYGLPALEPNRSFEELSPQGRSDFLNYKLVLLEIEGTEWSVLGHIFRRLQWSEKLTEAEKLWSYQTPRIVEATKQLEHHPYFSQIYHGSRQRKQTFQMICSLMVLAKRGPYANVSGPRLHDLAGGGITFTTEDIEAIKLSLDRIVLLFQPYNTKAMNEIAVFYQAISNLADAGCDFANSRPGCLCDWWIETQRRIHEAAGTFGFKYLAKVATVEDQARFWAAHYSSLVSFGGLVFRDRQRGFSELDKLFAWSKQGHRCANQKCNRTITVAQSVAHHIIAWADGGQTTSDNCAIFCPKCHDALHRNSISDPFQLEIKMASEET